MITNTTIAQRLIARPFGRLPLPSRGCRRRAGSRWRATPCTLDSRRAHDEDARIMLPIDLTGKRALVAGVADDGGFGFAIAKALVEAGATVCVGTWPPAYGIFTTMLQRGKFDESLA